MITSLVMMIIYVAQDLLVVFFHHLKHLSNDCYSLLLFLSASLISCLVLASNWFLTRKQEDGESLVVSRGNKENQEEILPSQSIILLNHLSLQCHQRGS
jgi:hypothetical protein